MKKISKNTQEAPSSYKESYSEASFLSKLKKYAQTAGQDVVLKALMMFESLKDPDTPTWAKGTIIAALGYFICPVDALPDWIPMAGYADDLGALASAIASVASHIKDEHKQKAQRSLEKWFGAQNEPPH